MDKNRAQVGLTLIEVLVAGALLAALSFTLLAIYQMGLGNSAKMDVNSDAYRSMVIALERLRLELRGASLVAPSVTGQKTSDVNYLYPKVRDGKLRVDRGGRTVWEGAGRIFLDAQGRLVKTDSHHPGVEQVLADLGPGGTLEFELMASGLLQATVRVEKGNRDQTLRFSERQMSLRLHLPN